MIRALDSFRNKTGADIKGFFEEFAMFCNTQYPLIAFYYLGENVDVKSAFSHLDKLQAEARKIEPLFFLKSTSLSGIDFWEILDIFTECQTKLDVIANSSKWLRSSIIGRNGGYITTTRALKTRENFEQVSSQIGSIEAQNDWFDIALRNSIEEEDYTEQLNPMFKIDIRKAGNFRLDNIVDNLDGDNILGKDINKEFFIKDGDIAVVSSEEAIHQSLNTILSSLKGSIPEFPNYGLPNEVIGSSIGALSYPSIFKHLMDMFQRDGRWLSVSLLDIFRKEDKTFLKINVRTITNNQLITNIKI